jgi:hypothetical protein
MPKIPVSQCALARSIEPVLLSFLSSQIRALEDHGTATAAGEASSRYRSVSGSSLACMPSDCRSPDPAGRWEERLQERGDRGAAGLATASDHGPSLGAPNSRVRFSSIQSRGSALLATAVRHTLKKHILNPKFNADGWPEVMDRWFSVREFANPQRLLPRNTFLRRSI